ncbi:hypothetical protein NECID01_0414 [Nematocida sp. AWRm77]|nr:hypothetical protein NECID01_0414 [Nematocida sp. AWRm77]
MAGINGYFKGKYISKRETHVIVLCLLVTIVYVVASYTMYFSSVHQKKRRAIVLELNKSLFVSHMNSVILNGIIVIKGFLERNMIQIVCATLINLFIFACIEVSILLYDNFSMQYGFFIISMINVLFNLYILYLAYTLRKEFGWFYYKAYGADPRVNTICTIRKTQNVFMYLCLETVISFWMFSLITMTVTTKLIGFTIAYYVLIMLHIIECKYESYILRFISIFLCLVVLGYLIHSISHFWYHLKSFFDGKKVVTYCIPIFGKIAMKILVTCMYGIFLIADLPSFRKGFHGYYTTHQRRKMYLNETN